jgi:hypothetical protein
MRVFLHIFITVIEKENGAHLQATVLWPQRRPGMEAFPGLKILLVEKMF